MQMHKSQHVCAGQSTACVDVFQLLPLGRLKRFFLSSARWPGKEIYTRSHLPSQDTCFVLSKKKCLLRNLGDTVGHISKRLFTTELLVHLCFALFTIARNWKQVRCQSTNEWIMKMCCIYTMTHYSAVKKN